MKCLFAGCVNDRLPHEIGCSTHWKALTFDERKSIMHALYTVSASAIEGNQERFDAARETAYQLIANATDRLEKLK